MRSLTTMVSVVFIIAGATLATPVAGSSSRDGTLWLDP